MRDSIPVADHHARVDLHCSPTCAPVLWCDGRGVAVVEGGTRDHARVRGSVARVLAAHAPACAGYRKEDII
eukprot:COSAG02_NODE_10581_length_1908_cov_1.971808_3_plen_71_part_00